MENEPHPGQPRSKGPQPGSPRVQSWIRTVLNPLIEAVEYELRLLKRGSLTWRFMDRKPEHLSPIVVYVSESRRALEDLLRARPYMEPPLTEHDRLLEAAVDSAATTHDWIVAEPEFLNLVESRLAEYDASHDATNRPSGAFESDRLPNLVADRMINNDGKVGWPYTDAEFWNSNREAFMALAKGPNFTTLRSAVEALLQHDVALLGQLKDWHFELVEEFDVEPI